MSEITSWPYTGSLPANGTLGEMFARRSETEVQRMLEGFSGYLVANGSPEEQSLFDSYLFGEQQDGPAPEALVNAIEAKFQTFSWGAELDRAGTTLGDSRTLAKPTFQGGIEISREVRYWNEDLTKYREAGVEHDADGEKPQLGFDRATGSDENLGTIIGVDDQGHPVVAQDTEETRIGFKSVYDVSNPQVSGLIAKFPKLKNAVAYTAVGRKRVKEFHTDSAVRKQLKQALLITKSRLIGEQYSMKGASSLVAKAIEDTMTKEADAIAGALISAVEGTTDGVRYTVDLDESSYTEGVIGFLDFLKRNKWEKTQFKNFWREPSQTGYRGINSKWKVVAEGQEESVEVQFHTRESYDAKEEKTHSIKEAIRILSNQLAEATKKLKTLSEASTFSSAFSAAAEELERLTREMENKLRIQKEIFDDMASKHTPKGAESIIYS
jgi:hypothetical protein